MMRELILATENENKTKEFREIFGPSFRIQSLKDISFGEALPEEGTASYEENVRVKAEFVGQKLSQNVFADDSGFEVEALRGAPGIISARFGALKSSKAQRGYVLDLLKGESNRRARFVCYLALYLSKEKK